MIKYFYFLEMKVQRFIGAIAPPSALLRCTTCSLLSGLANQGSFFRALNLVSKPDCREELTILHRNSHQKAGLKMPKAQNRSFPINYKTFFFFGNERSVFHRYCSPAIRFIPIEKIGMLAPVGFI
jgi:hypothetical protein